MDTLSLYHCIGQRDPGSVVFTSYYLSPLSLDRHSVIADFGSGYGNRATWVSRSRCCTMHLFEKEARCLDIAHERAEEGGASHFITLNLVPEGDYLQIPTPVDGYDLLITEGLSFEMDTLQHISTFKTHVKPGGALVVTAPGIIHRGASDEVTSIISSRRGAPLATLDAYHERIAAVEGIRLIHQVTLPLHTWEEHYQNLGRTLRGLLRSQHVQADDEVIRQAQAELDWYRSVGRGQVFLQAFVLGVD